MSLTKADILAAMAKPGRFRPAPCAYLNGEAWNRHYRRALAVRARKSGAS